MWEQGCARRDEIEIFESNYVFFSQNEERNTNHGAYTVSKKYFSKFKKILKIYIQQDFVYKFSKNKKNLQENEFYFNPLVPDRL